jgi:hypothetical protein
MDNHEKSYMQNRKILEGLIARGTQGLFHANSVLTACTFLENGALLSRHYVEQKKLNQTPQYSDLNDKEYGVYDDIFIDTVDYHKRISNLNKYGPVLFMLALEKVLSDKSLPGVRILKKNPTKWHKGDKESDRYFMSEAEFNAGYQLGIFDMMFTFPHCSVLLLKPYIKEIILDDPGVVDGTKTDYFKEGFAALKASASKASLKNVKISKRPCSAGCKCQETYKKEWKRWRGYFLV